MIVSLPERPCEDLAYVLKLSFDGKIPSLDKYADLNCTPHYYLVPGDNTGRFADFHSLRHSAASLLIQTGANPKVIQSLMRHSDLNLTMSRYTHLYTGQQRETIESLPDFVVKQDKAIMTGTFDCVAENQAKNYCPKTANQSSDLQQIITAWTSLPEHIKAAIKALIQAYETEKK